MKRLDVKKHASLFERKKAVKPQLVMILLPYHVVFFGWKLETADFSRHHIDPR